MMNQKKKFHHETFKAYENRMYGHPHKGIAAKQLTNIAKRQYNLRYKWQEKK